MVRVVEVARGNKLKKDLYWNVKKTEPNILGCTTYKDGIIRR